MTYIANKDSLVLENIKCNVGDYFGEVMTNATTAFVMVNERGWVKVWEWLDNGPQENDWIQQTYEELEGLGYRDMHLYSLKSEDGGDSVKVDWDKAAHFLHWPEEGQIVLGPDEKPTCYKGFQ